MEEKSLKHNNIFNDILLSMNQWRTEQMKKVQEIYDDHLKLVESHYDVLNQEKGKLFGILQKRTLQPIRQAEKQSNIDMKIMNEIQQSIKKIREDNVRLNWHISSSLFPINIRPPVISLPSDSSNSNIIDTNKSMLSTETLLNHSCNRERGRPIKRLVSMFSNISSIEKSKNDIHKYIQNIGKTFRLPTFVCSYLTAWYKKSNIDEKNILLNEYITIIKTYLSKRQGGFDVLIGLQAFFHNHPVKQNPNELMPFLLQFFLDHQCVNREQILDWYNKRDMPGYQGLYHAKHLAASFIKSLTENQTVNNVEPMSVNHSNQEKRDLLQ